MVQLNLKLLMVLSPDISDYINKEKKLLPTLLLVSMPGLLDYGTEVRRITVLNFKNGAKSLKKLLLILLNPVNTPKISLSLSLETENQPEKSGEPLKSSSKTCLTPSPKPWEYDFLDFDIKISSKNNFNFS